MIFPPGRLRLVTRPSLTGSLPTVKTIGIDVVACFRRSALQQGVVGNDHGHATAEPIPQLVAGSRSY